MAKKKPFEVRPMHPSRIREDLPNSWKFAEEIMFNEWKHYLSLGEGTLGMILQPDECLIDQQLPVPEPTQRDSDVAAAVIQWLGTNCGRAFIEGCQRTISKRREEVCEEEQAAWEKEQAEATYKRAVDWDDKGQAFIKVD